MPTKAAIRKGLAKARKREAPTIPGPGARRLLDHAARLRELGVDPFWLLADAYGTERRVQEWLHARGLRKSDVPYHLHEMLASDPGVVKAPSVATALADLAELQAEGHVPDALDDVTHALLSLRLKKRGIRPYGLSEERRGSPGKAPGGTTRAGVTARRKKTLRRAKEPGA